MSNQLLLSETKNFLAFTEDLKADCIIIFEKDGVFYVYAAEKKNETKIDRNKRLSEKISRLFHTSTTQKTSFFRKITNFFRGKK